ncbi:MAG: hypothetical protein KJ963_08425 [Bacteroidetes bacterium]|nr:hypothetical protein [Bacteroidota bacterium]
MKFDKSFLKQVFYILVGTSVLGIYPLYKFGSVETITAVVSGVALATFNIFLGYISIELAFEKSMTKFLKAILGGMGIRLLILLSAMVFFIKVLNFHTLAFTITLLGFYAIYLVIEILFIDKKVRLKTY